VKAASRKKADLDNLILRPAVAQVISRDKLVPVRPRGVEPTWLTTNLLDVQDAELVIIIYAASHAGSELAEKVKGLSTVRVSGMLGHGCAAEL